MSRPGFDLGPQRWDASILEKSHSNSLLIAIRNIYICARERSINSNRYFRSKTFKLFLVFLRLHSTASVPVDVRL
jgi:hypothetical protein